MKAGIYFPLFLVLRSRNKSSAYYLATEFQEAKAFRRRNPLSKAAKRAGWQGFVYDLAALREGALVRIL